MPSTYQRIFLNHNGDGPWPCAFCAAPVLSIKGGHHLRSTDGTVHHIDGDHDNDEPSNLTVAHHGCHVRHHRLGVPKTLAHRAKLSAALRGRTLTQEHRDAIRAGMARIEDRSTIGRSKGHVPWNKGQSWSPEMRAKLSAAHIGKTPWNKGMRKS